MLILALFHADWCGHCQEFKPTWERVQVWCGQNGIQCQSFEDAQAKSIIEMNNIRGYPTIVAFDSVIDSAHMLYTFDNRNYQSIVDTMKLIMKGGMPQKGGDAIKPQIYYVPQQLKSNDHYYLKYLKYKNKYMKLKEKCSKKI